MKTLLDIKGKSPRHPDLNKYKHMYNILWNGSNLKRSAHGIYTYIHSKSRMRIFLR